MREKILNLRLGWLIFLLAALVSAGCWTETESFSEFNHREVAWMLSNNPYQLWQRTSLYENQVQINPDQCSPIQILQIVNPGVNNDSTFLKYEISPFPLECGQDSIKLTEVNKWYTLNKDSIGVFSASDTIFYRVEEIDPNELTFIFQRSDTVFNDSGYEVNNNLIRENYRRIPR